MPARSDIAIILRLSEFSETSQVVTLLTRASGQVRLMAKGTRRASRRQFSAGLDMLELGDAGFVPPRDSAGLGTLTEWRQRDAFAGLRRSLLRLYGGLYAAEAVAALTAEHDPHAALFDALNGLLAALSAATEVGDGPDECERLARFLFTLLREAGFAPSFQTCVTCGRLRPRSGGAFFSPSAGGLLCRACARGARDRLALEPVLLAAPASAEAWPAWIRVFDHHLSHVAGRRMRTAEALLGQVPRRRRG